MYTYELNYSIESGKKVFVESYGFLSFTKIMNKVADKLSTAKNSASC